MQKKLLAKKLVLGTVQFGLKYGINNTRGKIPSSEVFEILRYASNVGINTLDTAYNYGQSEKIIGEYILQQGNRFNIISKFPAKTDQNIRKTLEKSLKRLHVKNIYGYLLHDFNTFVSNPQMIEELTKIKEDDLIQKFGFSLYYPSELETLLRENIKFDIVQIPFNIFDQRFLTYFSILKKKGIEVHIRSVFLQGLVFKKKSNLPKYFLPIKKHLEDLNKLANELNITVSSLCLNFALSNEFADRVIIGVDSISNLKENLENLKDAAKVRAVMSQLYNLNFNDENIIVPTNWENS